MRRKDFNRENGIIRVAFQKENWQRQAVCLPNMVTLLVSASLGLDEQSFFHCVHWTYCERELNFYCIKPLEFGDLSVIVAGTTSLSKRQRHFEVGLQQKSEHMTLLHWSVVIRRKEQKLFENCLVQKQNSKTMMEYRFSQLCRVRKKEYFQIPNSKR